MKLYFDGSNTETKTGYGFVLMRQGRQVIKEGSHQIPKSTSNVAEYSAVCAGILMAADYLTPGEPLEIMGDSQLVINQIEGKFKIKAPHLIKLRDLAVDRITQLRKAGHPVTLKWIRRGTNGYADRLAGHATA